MTVATSLIPGLDEIVKRGDPRASWRDRARHRRLFLRMPRSSVPIIVDLFDNLLIDLVPHAELASRVDLAERFSRLTMRRRIWSASSRAKTKSWWRARVLRRSPVLDEAALVEIARLKGQGHLLAITERRRCRLTSPTSGRRGDRDVVRRAAGNAGAMFSPAAIPS